MSSIAWKRVVVYGAVLAVGTLTLQWLDYLRFARTRAGDIYVFIIAGAFLAGGVYVGARLFGHRPPAFDGNPQAVASLGISGRELEVLALLAEGHSNGEIADRLSVSQNTVKTHVARLFEKLEARRRTDAIKRAREMGILR